MFTDLFNAVDAGIDGFISAYEYTAKRKPGGMIVVYKGQEQLMTINPNMNLERQIQQLLEKVT